MKKYIGLNGSVVEEIRGSNHNLKKSNQREVLGFESISKNNLDSGSASIEKQKSSIYVTSGKQVVCNILHKNKKRMARVVKRVNHVFNFCHKLVANLI